MADEHIQVLDRAFDIFEALARSKDPVPLGELAQKTGMSKSTVFRILHTMLERGYAEKTDEGAYAIGPKMFETLGYHINSLELATEAKPYLAQLKDELGLTAHLGILDGAYVSYIEKDSARPGEETYTQVGFRSPAYCSSMGKCLLACLSDVELQEALYGFRFERYTPNTFTDRAEFTRYLHQVRRDGWAVDRGEYELDHRCVAAPVFDYRGDAIASVGVSGTAASISDERIPAIATKVVQAGKRISKRMGYIDED